MISTIRAIERLEGAGKIRWDDGERAWIGHPEDVLTALADDGFVPCKEEVVRGRRDRDPAGGIWQGLDPRTGSVASLVWARPPETEAHILFIDLDGHALIHVD